MVNRIIYNKNNSLLLEGDNLQIMQYLLDGDENNNIPSYREKIDLIYIDPPFGINADKKFGRRWIMSDINKEAINTIINRMILKGQDNGNN